jgi:hypothetical protein
MIFRSVAIARLTGIRATNMQQNFFAVAGGFLPIPGSPQRDGICRIDSVWLHRYTAEKISGLFPQPA